MKKDLHRREFVKTSAAASVAFTIIPRLEYDSANMKITNDENANKLFYRDYRPGWEM